MLYRSKKTININFGFVVLILGLLFLAIGSCTEYNNHCEKCCKQEARR